MPKGIKVLENFFTNYDDKTVSVSSQSNISARRKALPLPFLRNFYSRTMTKIDRLPKEAQIFSTFYNSKCIYWPSDLLSLLTTNIRAEGLRATDSGDTNLLFVSGLGIINWNLITTVAPIIPKSPRPRYMALSLRLRTNWPRPDQASGQSRFPSQGSNPSRLNLHFLFRSNVFSGASKRYYLSGGGIYFLTSLSQSVHVTEDPSRGRSLVSRSYQPPGPGPWLRLAQTCYFLSWPGPWSHASQ